MQDTYTIDYDPLLWFRYDDAPQNDSTWDRAAATDILKQRGAPSGEQEIQLMTTVIGYLRTSTSKRTGFKFMYLDKDAKPGPGVIVSLDQPECTLDELPVLIEKLNPGKQSEMTFVQTPLGRAFRKRQRFFREEKKGFFRKKVEFPFEQVDYVWQPKPTDQVGLEAVITDLDSLDKMVAAIDKLARGLRLQS
jgi:hypothetical protein